MPAPKRWAATRRTTHRGSRSLAAIERRRQVAIARQTAADEEQDLAPTKARLLPRPKEGPRERPPPPAPRADATALREYKIRVHIPSWVRVDHQRQSDSSAERQHGAADPEPHHADGRDDRVRADVAHAARRGDGRSSATSSTRATTRQRPPSPGADSSRFERPKPEDLRPKQTKT